MQRPHFKYAIQLLRIMFPGPDYEVAAGAILDRPDALFRPSLRALDQKLLKSKVGGVWCILTAIFLNMLFAR